MKADEHHCNVAVVL